jgi:hypothetical protein
MATNYLAYHWLASIAGSLVRLVSILTMAGAASALCVLVWNLVRGRLAVDANWVARGVVVLGIAGLAFNYGAMALQAAGVVKQPSDLSEMADAIAGLTLDLWIDSAIVVLGAVIHVASSRLRRSRLQPAPFGR